MYENPKLGIRGGSVLPITCLFTIYMALTIAHRHINMNSLLCVQTLILNIWYRVLGNNVSVVLIHNS